MSTCVPRSHAPFRLATLPTRFVLAFGGAVAALRALGCQVNAPQAALYVWAQLPPRFSDVQFAERVLEPAGVSLTSGRLFSAAGAGSARLSLSARPRPVCAKR
jgi:aspartate/methionine/tyrosine aminotransferase